MRKHHLSSMVQTFRESHGQSNSVSDVSVIRSEDIDPTMLCVLALFCVCFCACAYKLANSWAKSSTQLEKDTSKKLGNRSHITVMAVVSLGCAYLLLHPWLVVTGSTQASCVSTDYVMFLQDATEQIFSPSDLPSSLGTFTDEKCTWSYQLVCHLGRSRPSLFGTPIDATALEETRRCNGQPTRITTHRIKNFASNVFEMFGMSPYEELAFIINSQTKLGMNETVLLSRVPQKIGARQRKLQAELQRLRSSPEMASSFLQGNDCQAELQRCKADLKKMGGVETKTQVLSGRDTAKQELAKLKETSGFESLKAEVSSLCASIAENNKVAQGMRDALHTSKFARVQEAMAAMDLWLRSPRDYRKPSSGMVAYSGKNMGSNHPVCIRNFDYPPVASETESSSPLQQFREWLEVLTVGKADLALQLKSLQEEVAELQSQVSGDNLSTLNLLADVQKAMAKAEKTLGVDWPSQWAEDLDLQPIQATSSVFERFLNWLEDQEGAVRVYVKVTNREFTTEGMKASNSVMACANPTQALSDYEPDRRVRAFPCDVHPPELTCKDLLNNESMAQASGMYTFGPYYGVFASGDTRGTLDMYRDNPRNREDVYEGHESKAPGLKNVLRQVQAGYTVVLFGYGYSGSGKTFTLLGTDKDQGVTTIALSDLASQIVSVTVQFKELYGMMQLEDGRPYSGESGIFSYTLNSSEAGKLNTIPCEPLPGDEGEVPCLDASFWGRYPGNGTTPAEGQAASPEDFAGFMERDKLAVKGEHIEEVLHQAFALIGNTRKRARCRTSNKLCPRVRATSNNPESSRGHLFTILEIAVKDAVSAPGKIVVVDMAGAEDPLSIATAAVDYTKLGWNESAVNDYVGRNLKKFDKKFTRGQYALWQTTKKPDAELYLANAVEFLGKDRVAEIRKAVRLDPDRAVVKTWVTEYIEQELLPTVQEGVFINEGLNHMRQFLLMRGGKISKLDAGIEICDWGIADDTTSASYKSSMCIQSADKVRLQLRGGLFSTKDVHGIQPLVTMASCAVVWDAACESYTADGFFAASTGYFQVNPLNFKDLQRGELAKIDPMLMVSMLNYFDHPEFFKPPFGKTDAEKLATKFVMLAAVRREHPEEMSDKMGAAKKYSDQQYHNLKLNMCRGTEATLKFAQALNPLARAVAATKARTTDAAARTTLSASGKDSPAPTTTSTAATTPLAVTTRISAAVTTAFHSTGTSTTATSTYPVATTISDAATTPTATAKADTVASTTASVTSMAVPTTHSVTAGTTNDSVTTSTTVAPLASTTAAADLSATETTRAAAMTTSAAATTISVADTAAATTTVEADDTGDGVPSRVAPTTTTATTAAVQATTIADATTTIDAAPTTTAVASTASLPAVPTTTIVSATTSMSPTTTSATVQATTSVSAAASTATTPISTSVLMTTIAAATADLPTATTFTAVEATPASTTFAEVTTTSAAVTTASTAATTAMPDAKTATLAAPVPQMVCLDSAQTTFTADGHPASCLMLKAFCEDAVHGAALKEQCPLTCGVCGAPQPELLLPSQ